MNDVAYLIEQLQPLVGNKAMPEHPFVLYYLGLSKRALGLNELAQAAAKPNEAAQRRQNANGRFTEAAQHFAAAAAAFKERVKPDGGAKDLPVDQEWVARRRPDIALCFEVLEHVPNAESALRTIVDSLPEGCEIAFSVPLHGRLEEVFGHLSIFDAQRVAAMTEAAGLDLVSAEPLCNRWTLVVGRKRPADARGAAAADDRDHDVHVVDPSAITSHALTVAGDQPRSLAIVGARRIFRSSVPSVS